MIHQTQKGRILSFLLLALLYIAASVPSMAATLLPNGKQLFTNANGTPLASGWVYFYIPTTLTPKTTWQDANKVATNTNPVQLDSSGEALIYGVGCYRQIVKTAAFVTIWDAITCDTSLGQASWGGVATGTGNAVVVTADQFTGADGQVIRFIASATNSGAATVNPSSFGAVAVKVDSASGPIPLTGGEMIQNNVVTLVYDAPNGIFHLSTLTTITAGAGLSTGGVGTSGGTISVAGTLTTVQPPNTQTGTTYTVLSTDNAKLVTLNNASSVAVALPQAVSTFASGWFTTIQNLGAGTAVITPTTSTVNGQTSLMLPPGTSAFITSDGTNYKATVAGPSYTTRPGGRLTLVTGVPVMVSDQSAKTAVFYTPYVSDLVPIYNGSSFGLYSFSQITLTLTSSQAASTIYDICAYVVSGAVQIGTTPAWTTSTAGSGARGTGAGTPELTQVNGVLVNANSMNVLNNVTTTAVAAKACTYLGSIFMDAAAGQVTAHFSYGQSRKFGLWNYYNRVPISLLMGDATSSWTYSTTTIRQSRATAGNTLAIFSGYPEEPFYIKLDQGLAFASNTNYGRIGIGVNSTTTISGKSGNGALPFNAATIVDATGYLVLPASNIGVNNINSLEYASGATSTFFGTVEYMQMVASWRG